MSKTSALWITVAGLVFPVFAAQAKDDPAPFDPVVASVTSLTASYREAVAMARLMDAHPVGSKTREAYQRRLQELKALITEQEQDSGSKFLSSRDGDVRLVSVAEEVEKKEPYLISALSGLVDRVSSQLREAHPKLEVLQSRIERIDPSGFSCWARQLAKEYGSTVVLPSSLPTMIDRAPGSDEIDGNKFPKGVLSLTFDDGPHPTRTQQMLEVLAEKGASGTFFMLGEQVKKFPKQAKLVRQYGHVVAAHSLSHVQLTKLSIDDLYSQLYDSKKAVIEAVGVTPAFFRCPYGARNQTVLGAIARNKMRHVFWNIDSLDWSDKDPYSVVDRVMTQLGKLGRGVALFHDIHPQSVSAVRILLERLRPQLASGQYRLLTIPEAVN